MEVSAMLFHAWRLGDTSYNPPEDDEKQRVFSARRLQQTPQLALAQLSGYKLV